MGYNTGVAVGMFAGSQIASASLGVTQYQWRLTALRSILRMAPQPPA